VPHTSAVFRFAVHEALASARALVAAALTLPGGARI